MNIKQYSTHLKAFLLLVFLQFQAEIVLGQSSFEFYEEGKKLGLKNEKGEILIPAFYEQLGWSQGLNMPVNGVIGYKKEHWGLISVNNKVITGARYYSLQAIHKNLIIASIKGKFSNELFYGVINFKGDVVVDFKYHSLKPLDELLIVSERKKDKSYYGLLSQQGKTLLSSDFNNISYFKDNLFVFTNANKQKGIIHKNGLIKIEATLDSIAPASGDYSLIMQAGKVGAIDSSGTILRQPAFKAIFTLDDVETFRQFEIFDADHHSLKSFYCDTLFEISSDLLAVVRNEFYEILNTDFEIVYRGQSLKSLSAFRKNVIVKNGVYRIIKYNGEPVNENGFDTLLFDKNYIYGNSRGQWDIFNKFGSNISTLNFDSLLVGSNNLIPVLRSGYWGYIDHSGKMAIPAKFDKAGLFIGNMAEVNYLGSRRIINQFGEFIGESNYDKVTIGKANTARVVKRGRTDLINYRGKILFQTYNQLSLNFFGYLESTAEGKVGLISHLGEVMLYPEYDSISEPKNRRYAVVKQGNKTGLVNFKGFWILPLSEETQEICHVNDGFISIKKNGQYGFVDFGQRLLIANRYEKTKPFTSELAAVALNDKWGFINKKEQLVIQPTYSYVTPFRNGISVVRRDGKFGAIDLQGKDKIKIEFDTLETTTHEFLLASKEDKIGLFNQYGDLLLQPSYTDIRPTMDDHFIVSRRGLYGLIDANGRYSIPLKYFAIQEISHGKYICLETSTTELE
ncbi:WG containing repeat-containing protein [Reichenbachiella faecimaris]|uniref:WG containing repeat-containing protein n=1 Tax=Reichenbachiella faecimaris TaxID=692418 RepID=A0A1W2GEG5_REIFA|nr:WG repeat-containing protein [Reichenbachiella faecimaris]SMD35037.1 WG containing repeat-containing protein [Reichenbachiella faecimaris]